MLSVERCGAEVLEVRDGPMSVSPAAVSLSSATGLDVERCEQLLSEARGDFNLAAARAFRQQRAAAWMQRDATALARPEDTPAAFLTQTKLTISGGRGIIYPRPSSSILSQHMYLIVDMPGERQCTEPIRRTSRPRWRHSEFNLPMQLAPVDRWPIRLTLCDLENHVIASGTCEIVIDSQPTIVAVQLFSTCEVLSESSAMAGMIEVQVSTPFCCPEEDVRDDEADDVIDLGRIHSTPAPAMAATEPTGTDTVARRMLCVQHNKFAEREQWCICDGCQSPEGDGTTELAVLPKCGHTACVHCLATAVSRILAEREEADDLCTWGVCCPKAGCTEPVAAEEVHQVLPPEHPVLMEYAEECLAETLGRIMSSDVTMVSCPQCASSFGVKPGTVGELTAAAQDQMKHASPEAIEDFAAHRVRCPDCSLEFCSACYASPFHIGADSCNTAQKAEEILACRFCGEELQATENDEKMPSKCQWWGATRTQDTQQWCSSAAIGPDVDFALPSNVLKDNQECWCCPADDEHWLTFDLMEPLAVSRIKIVAGRSAAEAPRSISVQHSMVSQSGPWETVCNIEAQKTIEPQIFELVSQAPPVGPAEVVSADANGGGKTHTLENPTLVHNKLARFWRLTFVNSHGGDCIRVQHIQLEVKVHALRNVCGQVECQARASKACGRTLHSCGHACTGSQCSLGLSCEEVCPVACLRCAAEGVSESQYEERQQLYARSCLKWGVEMERDFAVQATAYKQLLGSQTTADEYCSLCYTEALGAAPVLQLQCGHVLHQHCIEAQIQSRWSGSKISFGFLECPLCRADLKHPQLEELTSTHFELRGKVTKLAKEELIRNEGEVGAQKLADEAAEEIGAFARRKFVFKICGECDQAFCTGAADCGGAEVAAAEAALDECPESVICRSCASLRGQVKACDKHGTDHLMYKCRYCCNLATFECFGYGHFCGTCHEHPKLGTLMDFKKRVAGPLPYCSYSGEQYVNKKELGEYRECEGCNDGGRSCPLRVLHPRNGVEFCLGCSQCDLERPPTEPLLQQIRTMCGNDLYKGYAARIKDMDDVNAVKVELAACMLDHGAAALAADKLSMDDAMSWLESQGYTEWSTRLPPRAEVVEAFLCFELSPELEAIRNRPELSAVKIQSLTRAAVQQRRFRALKHATMHVQRVWRGNFVRQRMLKYVRLARVNVLEKAQRKRRAALLEQERIVIAFEKAVEQREQERRATAELIEAAVFAATPPYEAERAGQFAQYWQRVKQIAVAATAKAGHAHDDIVAFGESCGKDVADDAYMETINLIGMEGLAVPLRRGSMSRAERLGAWMDRRLSIGSSCSDESFHTAFASEPNTDELVGVTSMYADAGEIDVEGECQVNLSELRRMKSHDSV